MPASATSATLIAFPKGTQSTRAILAAALRRHRLPEELIEALVREAATWHLHTPQEALTRALTPRLKPAPIDLEKARGILLVGPSGAGKSAVAAKIAHAAALAGRRTEICSANDGLALFRTGTHPPERLSVMEAEGFNPINLRARNAFSALLDIEGVDSIGVVSALGDAEDVSDIVSGLKFKRVIVTGLDRTHRLGAAAAAILTGARLAHVTLGPRDDDPLESLDAATLARLLLQQAH
jgi:flagellar biosynthesis protein FlhF